LGGGLRILFDQCLSGANLNAFGIPATKVAHKDDPPLFVQSDRSQWAGSHTSLAAVA